jgi:hypothetical protein
MYRSAPCWRILLLFALIGIVSGCGGIGGSGGSNGGGSDGSNGGSGSGGSGPQPPPDFSLVVNPAQVTILPGWRTAAVEVSVKAVNGFSGEVTVTSSLPGGISCATSVCSGRLALGSQLRTWYFSAGKIAPGAYTVTFTGTSGALSHQATLTIQVNAPASPLPNKSGLAFTGDGTFQYLPYHSVIYDKSHDLVFAANHQSGEIDVISPESLQVVKRIPIPQPTTVDLSPDNSTLYVGTDTEFFYELDTALLQIKKRIAFQGPPLADDQFPSQVLALSDGTLMLVSSCGDAATCTFNSTIVLYSPLTGVYTQANLPTNYRQSAPILTPSADRSHIFFAAPASVRVPGQSMAELGRYDVETKSFTYGYTGTPVGELAVRPDGSGFAGVSGCCQILFFDANFNLLGTTALNNLPSTVSGGLVYSPDGSRLYAPDGPAVNVIDTGTFQSLGVLPSLSASSGLFSGWDGEQRLLGIDKDVVEFVDASISPGVLPSPLPVLQTLYGYYDVEPDYSSGGTVTVKANYVTQTPQITVGGFPASNVHLAPPAITFNAPTFKGVPHGDVEAFLPDGWLLYAPRAYSYRPDIFFADGNVTAEDGGTTLSLYGFGLNPADGDISVSIGGGQASNVTSNSTFDSPIYPMYKVTATVPRGTWGSTDITVKNAVGTAVVHAGFHYVRRTDAALPSTASIFQMILDKTHDRLLWTDTSTMQLVAFSLSSNEIEQQVSLGAQPAGLSLTPDASKILVVLSGSNQLNVYDADSLSLLRQTSTPAVNPPATPAYIACVADGKAFLTMSNTSDTYVYDIASNTFTSRSNPSGSGYTFASSDGTTALVGHSLWKTSTDSFVPIPIGESGYPPTLSADGAVISETHAIFDRNGTVTGYLGVPDVDAPNTLSAGEPGEQLNATGSLIYVPYLHNIAPVPSVIRIFDVRHGRLLESISLQSSLSPAPLSPIAIDPNGQALYALTVSGVSTFQFASDPLSIGEIQIAGNQVTILGSGFDPGAQVLIDGAPISASVEDSQHIIATLSQVTSGAHQLTVAVPSGKTYTLDDALEGFFSAASSAASDSTSRTE